MIGKLSLTHIVWIVCGAVVAAGAALYVVFGGPTDQVDRVSYGAGWDAVVGRQAATAGAASAFLRDDETVLDICLTSAEDGRAGLAGATDLDDFRAGCRDAVATALEPSDREVSDSLLDQFGPPPSTVCFDLPTPPR